MKLVIDKDAAQREMQKSVGTVIMIVLILSPHYANSWPKRHFSSTLRIFMPILCIFSHFLVLICLGLGVRLYYFLRFLHVWPHRSSALNILYGDRVNIDPGVNTTATRPKWEAKLVHSFTTTQRSLRFIGWQPEISAKSSSIKT